MAPYYTDILNGAAAMPQSTKKPFDRFADNIHSQNGEDGILAEILKRIGVTGGSGHWCVEYGAWDGKHLSNTFALVEQGWHAVYIEGDESKYNDLLLTAQRYPQVVPVKAFVARNTGEPDSLGSILAKTPIPTNFSVLSIDIDSYDLDTWESLCGYEPRIVIIEINSSIKPGVYHRHNAVLGGNSFSSTLEVAHGKGYELVCHTGNMIFVRKELVAQLGIDGAFLAEPSLLFHSRWLPSRSLKGILRRLMRTLRLRN